MLTPPDFAPHDQMVRRHIEGDGDVACETRLMDLPDAQHRIGRTQETTGRIERETLRDHLLGRDLGQRRQ